MNTTNKDNSKTIDLTHNIPARDITTRDILTKHSVNNCSEGRYGNSTCPCEPFNNGVPAYYPWIQSCNGDRRITDNKSQCSCLRCREGTSYVQY